MNLGLKLRKEFLSIFPVFIFFAISFTLINEVEVFLFEKAGMPPFPFIQVLLAAALISKVVFVIDYLPLINVFKGKALCYPIAWKTGLYWFILLIIRLLIRLFPFLTQKEPLRVEGYLFLAEVDWNLFISIQVYYLMLLFVFVTFRELTFKVGLTQMKKWFFGC